MKTIKKVLCVCMGNTCRSPMMQVILQWLLGDEYCVESAGSNMQFAEQGQPANEFSILCMKERGLDLTGHVSQWIGDLDLPSYSHIVCVDDSVAQMVKLHLGPKQTTIVLIANEENGGVPNPWEKGLPAYRECLALLDKVMPKIAEEIRR